MKCAALVVLLSVAASCSAASAEIGRVKRLTTFSKPPENAPNIGTRECKSQEDCSIKGTACTEDRRDSRRRCICEDGNPPSNGRCPNRKRGLREKCNRDDECIPQAHCIVNTTIHKTNKICVCEPDVEEVDNMCGGMLSASPSMATEKKVQQTEPWGMPFSWMWESDWMLPVLTLKWRSERKLRTNVQSLPPTPDSLKPRRMSFLQVVSYAFARSNETATMLKLEEGVL